MKPASPVPAWAVVVRSHRSEWIHWHTVKQTRAEAWEAFCNGYAAWDRPELEKQRRAGRYRLARVTVALEVPRG